MIYEGPPPGWHYFQTVGIVLLVLQRDEFATIYQNETVWGVFQSYLNLYVDTALLWALWIAIPLLPLWIASKQALWSGLDRVVGRFGGVSDS